MRNAARKLFNAGICVMPARRAAKRPVPNWKRYQERLPTRMELEAWFANGHDALCILAGAVSGNVEMIDFDFQGELFDPWMERVPAGLRDRLVVECSQSGGRHVIYRCEVTVCGSIKLAQRRHLVTDDDQTFTKDGNEYIILCGKDYQIRTDEDGTRSVIITLIETRGEGGIFLCAPTAGYELLQGDLADLPVITEEERDVLLMAAWELNEYQPVVDGPGVAPGCTSRDVSRSAGEGGSLRPGDDFNARGDVGAILAARGWVRVTGGSNEKWRRPGKSNGWSATFNGDVFYVFSSNAFPFEPNRGYSRFAVYTLLEHDGDYDAAASELGRQGFGERDAIPMVDEVDLSDFMSDPKAPGPIPDELLSVPGFIDEVMTYCMETSPYPNRVLAFAGALALQAFLAGRKIRDEFDTRTNIYLLALADSGVGKNRPRQVNREICHQVGLAKCLGDKFASGEGLQDAMHAQPSMLFQTDEIDGVLRTINRAADSRHESIPNTLLSFYTDSNSIVPMRVRAGQQDSDTIDQPSLVLLGTAVPQFFYQSLSKEMLTNGFFSRLMILEANERGRGRRVKKLPLPASIVAVADCWAKLEPGTGGNLQAFHPEPITVFGSPEAYAAIDEFWALADGNHMTAAEADREAEKTLWSRATERVCKLALIYAASENHYKPHISLASVQWARALVEWQMRRMLWMADRFVSDGEFHEDQQRVIRFLEKNGGMADHSALLRHMHVRVKHLHEVIDSLEQAEQVERLQAETSTRNRLYYRLKSFT